MTHVRRNGRRNTRRPRERAFVARLSVACWVLCLAFVAGMFLLPDPYRQLLWVPYTALLVVGVRAWNRTQEQIRREEAGEPGART